MRYPSRETVERLRAMYPQGTRIELVSMDDQYRTMEPGLKGTVQGVDDMANIHIAWESGSTLSAIYGVDKIRKL